MTRAAETLRTALASESPHLTLLRLTLLLVMLNGATAPWSQVPIRIVTGLMLLTPGLASCTGLWWLLLVAVGAGFSGEWYTFDNHKYLIAYWTMACAISTMQVRPLDYLATTGQRLMCLVFCFAVLWKILAGQYFDGSFLYWSFLTDHRLQALGAVIGNVDLDRVTTFATDVKSLGSLGAVGVHVSMPDLPRLREFTTGLSWLTVGVEASVALVCMVRRLYVIRHAVIMLFIIPTYFLLPVTGFAFVLTILGLAQCRPDDVATRIRYLVLAGGVQLTALPWKNLVMT